MTLGQISVIYLIRKENYQSSVARNDKKKLKVTYNELLQFCKVETIVKFFFKVPYYGEVAVENDASNVRLCFGGY